MPNRECAFANASDSQYNQDGIKFVQVIKHQGDAKKYFSRKLLSWMDLSKM